jgi:hypothetical protein
MDTEQRKREGQNRHVEGEDHPERDGHADSGERDSSNGHQADRSDSGDADIQDLPAGSVLDPATAERLSKDLVRELFECLNSAGAAASEDTRLFFPEGISHIAVHLKVGGGGVPAVDLEFTVSSGDS